MPSIPMSALRRALAEMAQGARRGVSNGYYGDHVMGGMALGGIGGGLGGGVADEMTPGEGTAYGPAGLFAGAALGATGGGAAKVASMLMSGTAGGARGLSRGLREAISERMAAREASKLNDVARFESGLSGRTAEDAEAVARYGGDGRIPLIQELHVRSQRPFARTPDAMDEMREMDAARRILSRTKKQRREATDPDEIADLDAEIAELTRLLGL